MTMKLEVKHAREQLVVKSNTLIQKTRYNLNIQQQKILLYIISKIKPSDDDLKIYSLDLKELCAVCGIELHGNNYKNFKANIKSLRDKSFWVETPDKDMLLSWLERIEINKNETTISFRLDDRLKPYLLELKNNFTSYQLENILAFKSKFSIRLYELLQSYAYRETEKEFTIQELKDKLEIGDKYKVYKDFRVKVIDKAIEEINKYTNLYIEVAPRRTNRFITSLIFSIGKKQDLNDKIQTYQNRKAILDK